jgi:hypothetical protein
VLESKAVLCVIMLNEKANHANRRFGRKHVLEVLKKAIKESNLPFKRW